MYDVNAGFDIYIRVYLLGLVCVILVVVMLILRCLIYSIIRQIDVFARQQSDRQMTKMILIQTVSIGSYNINNAYILISNGNVKDTN